LTCVFLFGSVWISLSPPPPSVPRFVFWAAHGFFFFFFFFFGGDVAGRTFGPSPSGFVWPPYTPFPFPPPVDPCCERIPPDRFAFGAATRLSPMGRFGPAVSFSPKMCPPLEFGGVKKTALFFLEAPPQIHFTCFPGKSGAISFLYPTQHAPTQDLGFNKGFVVCHVVRGPNIQDPFDITTSFLWHFHPPPLRDRFSFLHTPQGIPSLKRFSSLYFTSLSFCLFSPREI